MEKWQIRILSCINLKYLRLHTIWWITGDIWLAIGWIGCSLWWIWRIAWLWLGHWIALRLRYHCAWWIRKRGTANLLLMRTVRCLCDNHRSCNEKKVTNHSLVDGEITYIDTLIFVTTNRNNNLIAFDMERQSIKISSVLFFRYEDLIILVYI